MHLCNWYRSVCNCQLGSFSSASLKMVRLETNKYLYIYTNTIGRHLVELSGGLVCDKFCSKSQNKNVEKSKTVN